MKRGIKLLLFIDSWVGLALGMIGPIYAIFVQKVGGDILEASWAYFAFLMSSGVIIYIMGKWEDKVGHKETLVCIGYGIIALGCLSYVFVYDRITLILTQVILGLGSAILNPAFDALYTDYIDKKEEASEWADWEAMHFIVTALAAVAGGYVAVAFGFRVLFLAMFTLSLVSVATAVIYLKKKKYLMAESKTIIPP